MTRKFPFDGFMKHLPKDGPGEPLPEGLLEEFGDLVPDDLNAATDVFAYRVRGEGRRTSAAQVSEYRR